MQGDYFSLSQVFGQIVLLTTGSTGLRQTDGQQTNRGQTMSRVISRSASSANVGPGDVRLGQMPRPSVP
jgi:hypothetical protein